MSDRSFIRLLGFINGVVMIVIMGFYPPNDIGLGVQLVLGSYGLVVAISGLASARRNSEDDQS